MAKVVSTNDCWLWARQVNKQDYGMMFFMGRNYRAHRVVYESEIGLIPEGLEIDHLCNVTRCVNPHHLEPVTRRENMERKYGKDLCKRGHSLTPDNVYLSIKSKKIGKIGRSCRICVIANVKGHIKRKKL